MSQPLTRRLRTKLEQLASQGETISYRQLALLAEVPGPQMIRRLTEALEIIIREDHAAGVSACVASLVVSQSYPPIPRAGYFSLLRELGLYNGPDQGEQAGIFHAAAVQQVFQLYAKS